MNKKWQVHILACMHALDVHLHNYIGMKIEEEANEY